MRTAQQKIISDLADFQYLTVSQLLTLEEYKESSRSYVYKMVNELVAEDLVLALPQQAVTQPRLYTLTSRGRRVANQLGKAPYKRFRVGEEKERGENGLFVAHTICSYQYPDRGTTACQDCSCYPAQPDTDGTGVETDHVCDSTGANRGAENLH